MEKRRAHFSLARIKALIEAGSWRATQTSLRSATNHFGLVESAQLAVVVLGLESRDFYKSMTTIHDSKVWQDVYKPAVNGVSAYIKLQIVDEMSVVISFKRAEEEHNG